MKIQKSANKYTEAAYDEFEILQEVSKQSNTLKWKASFNFNEKKNDLNALNQMNNSNNLNNLNEINSNIDTHVVQLLNAFFHYGQNGKHFCMVFEILGHNLLKLIKKYNYNGVTINNL